NRRTPTRSRRSPATQAASTACSAGAPHTFTARPPGRSLRSLNRHDGPAVPPRRRRMNRAFLISRQTTGVARYLSLDWIDAVAAEIDGDDGLRTLAADPDVAVGITQVVTDGPEGDIVYHLQVGDSTVGFAAGAADPEHVRMEQTWDTA